MTERQRIVQHFTDNNIKPSTTIDVAVYLKGDSMKTRPELTNEKEYVEKVLKAGYKSRMAKDLFDDIQEAQKQPAKSTEKSE
jgi:hypothetical protein